MDDKTITTLELKKVLTRLAENCSFPVSYELALLLTPTNDLFEARRLQDETSEAVELLDTINGFSIGGARDIRNSISLADHGGVLDPNELLDIKYTLIAARTIYRSLERYGEQYPQIYDLAMQLQEPYGIIDTISRAISDRGEILDDASVQLSIIRHDLRIIHDRLLNKMQRMINDPNISPYLQEALVTQRDGRYVLPLRADFKGRIKAIVHDQSSSGATLFVEPLSIVDQNNQFRQLQLDERDEERKILTDLSDKIANHSFEINHTVITIAKIDLAISRAKYAKEINASKPILHPIISKNKNHPGTILHLFNARHPLLDPETVVPIDVDLDNNTFGIIITGPNTGGKTVTLKTVGLLALMAQSGLHIPAQADSELSIFEDIYADIGDEQSIEQSLSTFSGHITNIIRILGLANDKCLVILDELGAGTDPQEGAVLARALLDHLIDRKITTLVTTHHPELKSYAHTKAGIVNASVEFDLESLQPTYHLTIGLPGRSNALAIAQRLGLPESIVTNARSELSSDAIQAEDLLDEIHRQREIARQARIDAENLRKNEETIRKKLSDRLERIDEERQEIIDETRQEMAEQIQNVQSEINKIQRELRLAKQPLEIISKLDKQVEELADSLPIRNEYIQPEITLPSRRSIRLGDKVKLRRLDTKGIVTALSEEEAEIQVGMMRVRARISDIELPSDSVDVLQPDYQKNVSKESKTSASVIESTSSPGFELDIRGKHADDAIETLERYLEKAYLSGLPFVRIIHGKGTGKLRSVVRDTLLNHPYVHSHEAGADNEGGEGVTIAKLKDA